MADKPPPTVLVVATLAGRDEFAQRLSSRGLRVWPAAATRTRIRRAAVSRLNRVLSGGRFDWLIVTSRTVSEFVQPGAVPVAAVGPATAVALRVRGIEVDLVGSGTGGDALAQLLLHASPGRRLRALWPRAAGAGRKWPRLLRAGGVTVREIATYETRPRPLAHRMRIERAMVQGRIASVCFFAPSGVRAFVRQLSRQSRIALSQTVVASLGRSTSAELRRHGFEPTVQAHSSGLGDLADQIATAIAAHQQRRSR